MRSKVRPLKKPFFGSILNSKKVCELENIIWHFYVFQQKSRYLKNSQFRQKGFHSKQIRTKVRIHKIHTLVHVEVDFFQWRFDSYIFNVILTIKLWHWLLHLLEENSGKIWMMLLEFFAQTAETIVTTQTLTNYPFF